MKSISPVQIALLLILSCTVQIQSNPVDHNQENIAGSGSSPLLRYPLKDSKYHISVEKASWQAADAACNKILGDGATLVQIETIEEGKHVREMLKNDGEYWTSAYYSGEVWKWETQVLLKDFLWSGGKPQKGDSSSRALLHFPRGKENVEVRPEDMSKEHFYVCELRRPNYDNIDYYDCSEKEDGWYTHPTDFTRFIMCTNGRAADMACPDCDTNNIKQCAGEDYLCWDQEKLICNWPSETKCNPTTGPTTPETTTSEPTTPEPTTPKTTTSKPTTRKTTTPKPTTPDDTYEDCVFWED